jgi:hypothetical protein
MKPLIGVTMNLEVQPARNLNILTRTTEEPCYKRAGSVPILGLTHPFPISLNAWMVSFSPAERHSSAFL